MKSTENIKSGNLQILLVEDSVTDAILLKESILLNGSSDLSVNVVPSLGEALEHLNNNHVDAVLLDLSLPDSSGIETVRQVRKGCPSIPIVVLTGVNDEKIALDAVRIGAQDYLVKGQNDSALIVRAVRYAIERKQTEQELQKAKNELEERVKQRTAQLDQTITILSEEIKERKRAENEIRENQQKLRLLTAELQLTEERERRQIAQDLHDSIGQILAFSLIKLKILQKTATGKHLQELEEISTQLDKAIKEARTLSFDLSPSTLYDLGFEVAIEDLLDRMSKERKLNCNFTNCSSAKPLANDVKVLLYRSVRELLINAAKHAKANLVNVALFRSSSDIYIKVEDDGLGFDPSNLNDSSQKAKGFGIFSIRERLNHIGGYLKIESCPGKGTKMILVAPLDLENEKG